MRHGFHERLESAVAQARHARGNISVSKLSEAAGLNRDTIGKTIAKRDSWPTIETVSKLANALGVTPEYLAYGIGRVGDRPTTQEHPDDGLGLPILGEVASGIWVEVEAQIDDVERVPIPADPRFPAKSQYVLRPKGTSMNRVFGAGDLIQCVDISAVQPRDGNVVIIERKRPSGEIETSAKRLGTLDGQPAAFADSDDERWRNVYLPLQNTTPDGGETIRIIAVVVRAFREL